MSACLHDKNEYTFEVIDLALHGGLGVDTVLTQVKTGKIKKFYMAAANIDGITAHMNSLTDDLCSQWFNERPPKVKKK